MVDGFERHDFGGGNEFFIGKLPEKLILDAVRFENLWAMHPEEFPVIHLHGRYVKTPRWQQAYGHDYRFSGQVSSALAVPPSLEPFLGWCREKLDERLNGLLLNWYDGDLGHYIGAHKDNTKGLFPDAPLVTISLGETRTFRLTQPETKERRDFPAPEGTVFVMPYETNRVWKHEVTKSAKLRGRRISITLRAFAD